MSAARTPAERAARLLRWYPRVWRDRYGEEFSELLISDIEERPRSAGRGFDVARAGLSPRVLAVEVRLAEAACGVMVAVLGAAALWVATSGGGNLASGGILPPFHAGLIDLACTGLLAIALPVAVQASRMARRELLFARSAR